MVQQQKIGCETTQQHQKRTLFSINEYGIEKIMEVVRVLLEEEGFESDAKAKKKYPGLCTLSPPRTAILEIVQELSDAT